MVNITISESRGIHMKKRIIAIMLVMTLIFYTDVSGNTQAVAKDNVTCMVSSSGDATGVLTPEGNVLIFGSNHYGQIGNGVDTGDYTGDSSEYAVIKPYCAMKDVTYISIQNLSAYAIKKDKTLWSWGNDCREVLGNGDGILISSNPDQILENVKFVATGHGLHMLAIKEDNTLWGWGQNDYGEVGNGKTEDVGSPVKVMNGVIYAAVGYGSSAVIKEDDSLWMWGNNIHGELGNGTVKEVKKPFKVMENVKMVICGFHRTVVLKEDGTVWAWGQNDHGEIGDGSMKERHKPVQVKGLKNVVAISTKAEGHMLALKKDGTVWAWGNNEDGEIGNGTKDIQLTPVKVLTNAISIETNEGCSYAIKKDNTLWAWGYNGSGQLGTGNTKSCSKPTKVFDLDTISDSGKCTFPTKYIDGSLDDWDNPEPIFEDPLSDAESSKADLDKVYGYMDKKNLYLAINVKGKQSDIRVSLDVDSDGDTEYDLDFGQDRNLLFISKKSWSDCPMQVTVNYEDGLYELSVPLSVIGTPKKVSIWVITFTDGIEGWCDDSEQLIEIPVNK